jgi:hypothetical protein
LEKTYFMKPAPLWLKILYTIFVIVLVPVYWKNYGPTNFLWFSDIALFAVGIALWTNGRLLISMMATGVLLFEIVWNIDFFFQLITGMEFVNLTNYMFDESYTFFLRGLSLFHVALPVIVVLLLFRWGYDRRALLYQTILVWIVLPATFFVSDPKDNINWVYGLGEHPQDIIPQGIYLGILMILFPALIYFPSHIIMKKYFKTYH